MMISNFEILSTKKVRPQYLAKRLSYLEHATQQLKEYKNRCCKSKVNLIQQMIVDYESLIDTIQIKLDKEYIQ